MQLRTSFKARARTWAVSLVATALLLPTLSQAQTITTIAGNGTQGFSGDGGPATSASINYAYGVAVDATGNRYIADIYNFRIRKVTPGGVISTVAGNGNNGFSGDGGPATSASLGYVHKVAVDASGTLYLADYGNNRIRKVAAGVITTIAGNGGFGFSGDGSAATSAQLRGPVGIALDAVGNVFFTDYENHRIRKISVGGVISTVAGNGMAGFSGDGGPAIAASLSHPLSVGVDSNGNILIADYNNNRIRKVGTNGVISTIAGNGNWGFSGDGGPAIAAMLREVWDVQADGTGNVYIADAGNHRIRKVTPGGMISTFAGNGSPGFSGDGGAATSAQLYFPAGLTVASGSLHIADSRNLRIRKVALFTSCAAEGYTGAKLTLCRQVCEIDQSPSRLTSLIKFYMAAFRSEPPCAR